MSDRRIYVPGGCDSDCSGSCEGCGSGAIPIIGACNDPEVLFNPGTLVKCKLTGDTMMILERGQNKDGELMYVVRAKSYELVQMFDFELEVIE